MISMEVKTEERYSCTVSSSDSHSEDGRLYLKGRYRKLQRGISQTPFALRTGEVLAEKSVEGILMDAVKSVISGESMKFIPAGREDMDVRMLGDGRPFAIEIKKPNPPTLSNEDLMLLNEKLSDSSKGVVALDVCLAKRNVILEMKMGEEDVHKTYRALVWISRQVSPAMIEQLNNEKELTIHQQTPLRVAHRRANLTREKIVHWMEAKLVENYDGYFMMELCASAGCYIKEFIHGDFGRSQPSIAEILQVNSAQCFALDVIEVGIKQEPKPTCKKSKH